MYHQYISSIIFHLCNLWEATKHFDDIYPITFHKTKSILKKQVINGLKKVKKINKIIFAYEPVWCIGTGKIPKIKEIVTAINPIQNEILEPTIILLKKSLPNLSVPRKSVFLTI